jgi:hypothetical protein
MIRSFIPLVLLSLATLLPIGQRPAAAQQTRTLAPGVLTVIPPDPLADETYMDPIALRNVTNLNWTPNFTPKVDTLAAKASHVVLRHNVWNLEFAFKPLRMVYIDVPQPNGKMHRKLIWYMVYRVRNLGGHLSPKEAPNKTWQPDIVDNILNIGAEQASGVVRFFPHFVLESRELGLSYLDRVIPAAIPVIQQREMRGGKLYSTVEITKVSIPVTSPDADGGVWGVATWEGVDPRIDYFSIFVGGLTNAVRFAGDPPDPATHLHKNLQLNFWRPGDEVDEHEGEIRYGIPSVEDPKEQAEICTRYNLNQRLDHLWVYR